LIVAQHRGLVQVAVRAGPAQILLRWPDGAISSICFHAMGAHGASGYGNFGRAPSRSAIPKRAPSTTRQTS
jgi:hypothetical protein